MADILGWKIPISIRLAAAVLVGYGAVRTYKFARSRLNPETDEQLVARLEQVHREGEVR